jgi:hypothetical protein
MKQDNFQDPDPQLRGLLREWRVNEPLPPRFQERVWKRIETAETKAVPAPAFSAWLGALFMRPAFAAVLAALLLAAGTTAGYLRANHDATRWDKQLEQRYVAALDPYAGGHQ